MSNSTNTEFVFSPELDKPFLDSLYEGDLSYASEVFENFLTESKKEFGELKEAHQANDIKKARHKFHKMKPTFAFVGLTALTEEVEEVIKICDVSENIIETEPRFVLLLNKIELSFNLIEKESARMKNHI
jgi:hypothetical protein